MTADVTTRIGKTAAGKACALALLLLSGFAVSVAFAKEGKHTVTRLASVTLQTLPNGFLLVPVKLHGADALMYFNTRSAVSLIYEAAANRFGLQARDLDAYSNEFTAGGDTLTKLVNVDSLQIGNVLFGKNTQLLVAPGSEPRHDGTPIIGALGTDLFTHVDFELDLAHRTLNLFSQDHSSGGVYWSDSAAVIPMYRGPMHDLYFSMELDGKRIETGIATGQEDSSLAIAASRLLFNFDTQSPGNEVEADSGKHQLYYRAMKLTTPGLAVSNAKIQLRADNSCKVVVKTFERQTAGYSGSGCLGQYPLELGRDVLKKLRLYFATKERVLYVTAADASAQANSTAPGTN